MCVTTHCNNSHHAKLTNYGMPGIWVCFGGHLVGTYYVFNSKTGKTSLTNDVTFLEKSFSEWNNVEKPTVVPVHYEGSDDEEEVKTV